MRGGTTALHRYEHVGLLQRDSISLRTVLSPSITCMYRYITMRVCPWQLSSRSNAGSFQAVESDFHAKESLVPESGHDRRRGPRLVFVFVFGIILFWLLRSARDNMKPDRSSPEYMHELSTALRWDPERQELYLRLPSFPHLRLVLLRPGIEDDLVGAQMSIPSGGTDMLTLISSLFCSTRQK